MKNTVSLSEKCPKRSRAGILTRNTKLLRPRKLALNTEPSQPFIAPILGGDAPCN